MVRALLIRGMLAGVLAGLVAFAFAWIFGEPQINLAIAFEQHTHAAAKEAPGPELVSRAVQSTTGLLTGIVVYGCALGGIFSLVFAYAYGRIGSLSPRSTAAILAILGFVALNSYRRSSTQQTRRRSASLQPSRRGQRSISP
jgi:TRAP-type C4-dicarboxylate transport system permease large subunit